MPTVATVRLRYSSQEYWFDPNESRACTGDHVIVETARGQEMGLCTLGEYEVQEGDVTKPLKPIVRVASEDDLAYADELNEKGERALRRFRELIEQRGLDMKPVDVRFMFDGRHATFYFTAEERVDFRALVRDLASEYHLRVDMRQIGSRDETRMMGGFGHCGEELCCARMTGKFQPVSIRMAKEQDLPLNPSKISGTCGRLMCCLRYEYDAYKDFKGRAPKKGALIDTPLGMAKVVEFDTPREMVRVRFEDGKSLTIPVAAMDTGGKEARPGERVRPCHISQEKFDQIIEELHHDKTLAMMGERAFSSDAALADKAAAPGAIERNPQARRRRSTSGGGQGQQPRKRRSGGGEAPARDQRKARRSVAVSTGEASTKPESTKPVGKQGKQGGQQKKSSSRSRRRRRGGSGKGQAQGQQGQSKQQQTQGQQQGGGQQGKPRPGQHSSTVSGSAAHEGQAGGQGQQQAQQGTGGSGKSRKRRRRRRSSGGGGNANGNAGGGQQGQQGAPQGANKEGD